MTEESNTEVENEIEDQEETDQEEQEEGQEEQDDGEQEEGPLTVTIGDDEVDDEDDLPAESEDDTDTIKKMRAAFKKNKADTKAKDARLKELEDKEAERVAAKEQKELRPKPNRDDYEYGQEDKYDDDLIEWNEDKKQFEAKKDQAKEKEEHLQSSYNDRLQEYKSRSKTLDVESFDDIEDKLSQTLSIDQMQLAIYSLDTPELLFTALSRNSKELERLADIADNGRFLVEAAKMEARLKTSKGRKAPNPETRPKGKAAIVKGDTELDRLRSDADKSGDNTKVIAYKRAQRENLAKAS